MRYTTQGLYEKIVTYLTLITMNIVLWGSILVVGLGIYRLLFVEFRFMLLFTTLIYGTCLAQLISWSIEKDFMWIFKPVIVVSYLTKLFR